jgi:hypothetical protein
VKREGFSISGLLLAAMIVAMMLPLLIDLLVRDRRTAVRTRRALLALHAARAEIEDVRVMAVLADDPLRLAHDFRPLAGQPLDSLRLLEPVLELPRAAAYPEEYRRIFTRLTLEPTDARALLRGELTVRWQETGGDGAPQAGPVVLQRFPFLVAKGVP